MDEKHTNDTLLIERYLQGGMSAEEAADFEELFLSSDDLLDELEAGERLQQGLKDIVTLEKANASAEDHRAGGFAHNTVSIFRSPRYAMVASFLLLVSFGFSGYLVRQNMQLGEFSQQLSAPPEFVPLVTVRGSTENPVNILNLSDTRQHFVLMLDPGYGAYTHFRATVFNLDSADQTVHLWQVDNMTPNFENMLAFSVPGSVLRPGNFEVHLEGWREEWPAGHAFETISTIPFSCTKK